MKTKKKYLVLIIMALLCLTSCVKDYSILVSSQDLRFGLQSDSQTITLTTNCKWTITKNDDADWYTISPMSGRTKDSIITVTVKDYSNGDFRGSSFVINSPGGHVYRTVFVSQNKIDFYSMVNKIYGAVSIEKWNTDFYNQIVEDSYKHRVYDPYDTTQGQLMYFLEDGKGVQRNRVLEDYPIYYPFKYEYDPANNTLHIEFETEEGPEPYDPEVLNASDSIFRIYHEYKPHWHERADMRKIGVVTPGEKTRLMQKIMKRKKGGEPIFIME